MNVLKLIVSFLKVGIIGFGGGSALIPVIEKEIIENQKMVPHSEYSDYIIAGNITPGAIQIKLAAACGDYVSGHAGLLAASYAITFPGTFLTILVLSLISILSEDFLFYVEKASVGIFAFIIFLLFMYINKVMKDAKRQNFLFQSILIMTTATILSFGKEVRKVLTLLFDDMGTSLQPIIDISVINLLLISFFAIFFLGGRWERKRVISAVLIILFFLYTISIVELTPWIRPSLIILMTVLAFYGAKKDITKELHNRTHSQERIKIDFSRPLVQSMWFVIFIAAALLLLLLFADKSQTIWYATNGFISTITSFGGGEAYITVADGIFVAEDFIRAPIFYSQILPIANAFPGPILVKVLSGVGYSWGVQVAGQPGGWLAALLGMTIGVGGSCIFFVFILTIYNRFSSLAIFKTLKQWILPVICGLLISTTLSMVGEMLIITSKINMNPFISLSIGAGIYFMCWFLHRKCHLPDVLIIILSAGISLGVIGLF